MVQPIRIRGAAAPSAPGQGRVAYRGDGRAMTAVVRSAPPPVGGWNTRDALDMMDPSDAVKMVNWFPRTSDCISRPGYALHCDTGEGSHSVQFLRELNHESNKYLLAGCNGKLIDVTSATPSTEGSGFSSNLWQAVQFKGKLFLANGIDAPQDWDGSTLTATSWSGSGLTVTNLIQPFVFKNRLFFVEKNKAKFWYTATAGSITGTLTAFDVAENLSQGGDIVFITKINRDGGDGPDDLFVIMLNTGYAIVYQGTDPGDAQAWSLVGTYFVGQPIGVRGFLEVGSDVILITKAGYVALTTVLPFGRALRTKDTISDKIAGAASDAIGRYGSAFNWGAIVHAAGDMLMINVPISATASDQHVMNMNTNSWTRFVGIPSYCWAVFNEQPYFGGLGDGKVYAFDQAAMSDAGTAISCDAQTAFNYLGDRNHYKNFLAARIIFVGPTQPPIQLNSGADFQQINVGGSLTPTIGSVGAEWDLSQWDVSQWAGANASYGEWQTLTAAGYCVSLRISLSLAASRLKWQSSAISYERGGML